ncbi:hypothetical protein D9758_006338 [Tetrapyrgos nigripes]|uniref:Uncharacterized protein n=1 Tax=Tetrapyrgos nigripes TaxID=182062 RepID=A0A8H5G0E2_9AGAR|nr:hypothetical protein D9758_006338 [Tetrapyrgos nigripes]
MNQELFSGLHSPSSLHVWRHARRNVMGLPSCPPDLNEFQYAILAFDRACHITAMQACGRENCENVLWAGRVRCCRNYCHTELLVPISDLKDRYEGSEGQASSRSMIKLLSPIIEYLPYARQQMGAKGRGRPWQHTKQSEPLFSALYFDQVFFEYEDIIAEKDESLLKPWAVSVMDRTKEFMKHVALCEAWHEMHLEKQAQQVEKRKQERKKDIEKRLTAIGWGPEVERARAPQTFFSTHRLVRLPTPLTDEEWENILPKFVDMMEAEKERWEENLCKESLVDRCKTTQDAYKQYVAAQTPIPGVVWPPLADVIQTGIFSGLLVKTPLTEPLQENEFTAILAAKVDPSFAQTWAKAKKAEVQALIQRTITKVKPESADILDLACAVMECNRCRNMLWYPDVLEHSCLFSNQSYYSYWGEEKPMDEVLAEFDPCVVLRICRWNQYECLSVWKIGSRNIQSLIKTCGASPSTTTLNELDELNPIIKCMHTYASWSGADVECKSTDLKWRDALLHYRLHHIYRDVDKTGLKCVVQSFTRPGQGTGKGSMQAASALNHESMDDQLTNNDVKVKSEQTLKDIDGHEDKQVTLSESTEDGVKIKAEQDHQVNTPIKDSDEVKSEQRDQTTSSTKDCVEVRSEKDDQATSPTMDNVKVKVEES